MQQTTPTENTSAQIVPEIVLTIDLEESKSDTEAFTAPRAPEHDLTKNTMLPFKDHKFGRTC